MSSRTMVICVSSVTVTQEDKEKNASEQSDDQGEKDGQSRMKMEVSQSDVITVLYCLPPFDCLKGRTPHPYL